MRCFSNLLLGRADWILSEGLIVYPPVGRMQQLSEAGKMQGRNELISDAIERWVGVKLGRKQVSSHIQVLKVKVKEDKWREFATIHYDHLSL